MSLSLKAATPIQQPFECSTCGRRFTRHENLKRHSALHSRTGEDGPYECYYCHVTFSRRDLQQRHMKRKHGGEDYGRPSRPPARTSISCPSTIAEKPSSTSDAGSLHDSVTEQHALVEKDTDVSMIETSDTIIFETPTEHDAQYATSWTSASFRDPRDRHGSLVGPTSPSQCLPNSYTSQHSTASLVFSQSGQSPGQSYPALKSPTAMSEISSTGSSRTRHSIPDGLSTKDLSFLDDDWTPSALQISEGYRLYFTYVSHFVPFLHRPTFDATETPSYLGLSMICLGYQYGEDPDQDYQSGSGATLSKQCFHLARVQAASAEEQTSDMSNTLALVQAYWLLQICAVMFLCGEYSIYGFRLHSRMIFLTRFGGLTAQKAFQEDDTEDLEKLWRSFIKVESQRRTLLAVHQLDSVGYQLFSIPRSLSHLEIKHDLPSPEQYWTASSSMQWAHRRLTTRQPTEVIAYADAVRRLLSADSDIESLPQLHPCGVLNIIHFLLSSVREVSGWSTMTWRVSMDRFGPLQSSLVALEKFIRPDPEERTAHTLLCEATWEMAMIELQSWSQSHTSGVVSGSVDALLKEATIMANNSDIVIEESTAANLQSHLDWFLRYLDTRMDDVFEVPWMLIYAYKAFLVALQLVKAKFPAAMDIVGINPGDCTSAISWARRVFQTRRRSRIGQLISSSLDLLV